MPSRRPGAAALAAVSGACAGPTRLAGEYLPPPASRACQASEDGRVIARGGERYAEVGCRSDRRARCRALWVDYAGGMRVWPFTPRGFDEHRPDAYDPGDPKIDFQQAAHVVVARDGSRVWWWHRGGALSSGGFHVFHILEDRLEDVDRADVWEIWALVHEGRAVPLGGAVEPWPR